MVASEELDLANFTGLHSEGEEQRKDSRDGRENKK
jgi:hypothetical protein